LLAFVFQFFSSSFGFRLPAQFIYLSLLIIHINNNMPDERTPLVNDESLGSIVTYTFCSNGASGDRSAATSTKRKLWFAVVLATCFFITELIAGYYANSLGRHLVLLSVTNK
jgi:hypothetical protein